MPIATLAAPLQRNRCGNWFVTDDRKAGQIQSVGPPIAPRGVSILGGERSYKAVWAVALLVAVGWCVQFAARASPGHIPMAPRSPVAAFEGDAPVANSAEWLSRRAPLLREAFLARIYGAPPRLTPEEIALSTIDADALDGSAHLELLTLRLGPTIEPLNVALLTPRTDRPAPLIILSDFCGLDHDIDPRLPNPSWRAARCRSRLGRALTQLSHGDAVLRPPVRAMIARGYAVAVFYAGDVAPDNPTLFRQASIGRLADHQESGAISTWAALYLAAFETLRLDPRIAPSRIAVWGHSRFGKAALLAAALEPRIGAVIANQSGTLGATLSGATRGESERQIMRRFPHWFPTALGATAPTRATNGFDQHLLLALLAPRPVLLGNAGLDRWSDPAAAFAAARAANDAYALFDSDGLAQPNMHLSNLAADIAFYVRPGGHGVRSSDWDRALDFLDVHFASGPGAAAAMAGGA